MSLRRTDLFLCVLEGAGVCRRPLAYQEQRAWRGWMWFSEGVGAALGPPEVRDCVGVPVAENVVVFPRWLTAPGLPR